VKPGVSEAKLQAEMTAISGRAAMVEPMQVLRDE
jgi:hypothetical protein